jgi:hypothetical protein
MKVNLKKEIEGRVLYFKGCCKASGRIFKANPTLLYLGASGESGL